MAVKPNWKRQGIFPGMPQEVLFRTGKARYILLVQVWQQAV
jgi:hypothetical protein